MNRPTIVRAVILDVDGTLVDSNDAHAHAWVRALREGGHHVTFERVRRLIGMGGDKVIPALTGLEPHGAAGRLIADRRRAFFTQDYLPLLDAQPGAQHLLLLLVVVEFLLVVSAVDIVRHGSPPGAVTAIGTPARMGHSRLEAHGLWLMALLAFGR